MKSFLLLFLTALGFPLLAQMDYNFEYLNHESRYTSCSNLHVTPDSIIYVKHSDKQPRSSLEVVYPNRESKTIYDLNYGAWESNSRKILHRGGAVEFIFFDLFDIDITGKDAHSVLLKDGDIKINILEDAVITKQNEELDSLYNVYFIRENKLGFKTLTDYYGDASHIEIDESAKLFRNIDGQVYVYHQNIISLVDTNLNITPILELSSPIKGIILDHEENMILIEDQVLVYDAGFSVNTISFPVPNSTTSANLIVRHDTNTLKGIAGEGNSSRFFEALSNAWEWENPVDKSANDHIQSLQSIDEDGLLLQMQFKIEDYSNQIYFTAFDNYYHVDQARVELDIDSIYFALTEVEVIDDYGNIYSYDLSYNLKNVGTESSFETDIYTDDYSLNWGNITGHHKLEFDQLLEPNAAIRLDTMFDYVKQNPQSITLGATGANNIKLFGLVQEDAETIFLHNENEAFIDVKIFPNPSKDKINIKGIDGSYTIRIFDIQGQLYKAISCQNDVQIDIKNLAFGMYLLEIENESKVSAYRIVKE